jgi:hypothetical protein
MDESIYLRLKASRNSNATKTNKDPTEKTLKKLSYKILDLINPLWYLASRTNFKEEEEKRFYRNSALSHTFSRYYQISPAKHPRPSLP